MAEPDPLLRRLERGAAVACVAMAGSAFIAAQPRIDAALGVLSGGVLALISYWGIRGGIDVLATPTFARQRPGELRPGKPASSGTSGRIRTAVGLVKFFTRYAILAVAAYVIMARLRLPPVAVLVGASSLVVAVVFEAVRGVASRPR